jgi:hypothetical protein
MKNKLFTVAFWLPVLLSVCLILVDSFQAEYTPREIQVNAPCGPTCEALTKDKGIDVIFERSNNATVDTALDTMKELVRNEYDRFKHIDAKATTFIGMLSISLAVFASLGGVLGVHTLGDKKPDVDSKQKVTDSNGQKLVRNRIMPLYLATFALLLFSFFFSMLATRVPYAPASEFIVWEIPGLYDINPKVVIGKDYMGLDHVQYKKQLLRQLVKAYATNIDTNNVKATRLSRSQLHALVAGITLVDIAIIAILGVIWGPPSPKLHIDSATAPPTGQEAKVLETKSA